MDRFPQDIDKAIYTIAKGYKMRMAKDTHYDASNRVLEWSEENTQKRLDFTYVERNVTVTFYRDRFPFWPKLLIWCHSIIPLFPYLAKVEWERMDELPLDETHDFYNNRIRRYIEYARSK